MYKKAWWTCKVVVLFLPIVFLKFLVTSASLDLKVPIDLLKNKRCLNQSLVLFYLLLYQLVVWTRSFREMTALPRLEFLSFVIWSRVFWLYVTWNLRKAQRWSESFFTSDRCHPHSVRDEPLEKLWGGGEFSSLRNIFSLPNSLHEFF